MKKIYSVIMTFFIFFMCANTVSEAAVTYTLSGDSIWANSGDQTQASVTHAKAGDNVNVNGHSLIVSGDATSNDGGGLYNFTLGDITGANATSILDIGWGGNTHDFSVTVNSVNITDPSGRMQVDNGWDDTDAITATVTNGVTVNELDIRHYSSTVAADVALTINGALSATTTVISALGRGAGSGNATLTLKGSSIGLGTCTFDNGTSDLGTTTLTLSGSGDQAVTGTINGANANDGILNVNGAGNTTFSGAIGTTSLNQINIAAATGKTAEFSSTAKATTITMSGAGKAQFDGAVTATTLDVTGGGTVDIRASSTLTKLSGSGGTIRNDGSSNVTITTGDATNTSFAGVITDGATNSIAITKQGSGTLTLSGLNAYSGATTISAGTLKAGVSQSGTSGAFGKNSAVTLSNADGGGLDLDGYNATIGSIGTGGGGSTIKLGSGTLTVGALNAVTAYAGVISGSGGMTTEGTCYFTLSNVNTYTGATTVGAGSTLVLDNDGRVAASSGVAANGTFRVDSVNSKTIQQLTGTGQVVNVSALATLTIGDANNRSSDFSGVISGSGAMATAGTGTLSLSGTNTYTGATTIGAGSTIQVQSAGALSSSNVTNSLASGTLDLGTTALALGAGSYTQGGATSELKLTANSSSSFGSITATGVNAMTNGIIDVTVDGYIPNGATLAILTGGAGSTYAPASILSSNSLVTFSGSSSGGIYTLTANRSATGFASIATNSNSKNVGNTLDNITNPSSDMTTVLNTLSGLSANQIASSENTMSPTVDGAITQSAISMMSQVIDTMTIHLDNMRTGGVTGISTGDEDLDYLKYLKGVEIWAQGLGDYAHQDPRGSSNGYNATSWGVAGGADIGLCNDLFRMGLGSGYGQTFVRSKDSAGRTDIDSIPGTLYLTYDNSKYPFYLDSAFTFMYNTYSGSRKVNVGTLVERTASADYNGQQYCVYFEGGYSFFYKKLRLTPLASVNYMHLHTSGYTETGAGSLSLTVNSQDYDMCQTGIGGKIAYLFETKIGTILPDLHARWLYDWVGSSQATTAGFTGGGASFGTNGFRPARSEYDMGTKLTIKTKYNIAFDLNYDFLLKEDYYEHYGTANIRYSF